MCVLNSMASPCKWEEDGDFTDKLRERLYKEGGKDWSYEPSLRIVSSHQKPKKTRNRISPRASGVNKALPTN